jgi:hypothetical protein
MIQKNKFSQKALSTLIHWLKKELKLEPMKPDLQSMQALNSGKPDFDNSVKNPTLQRLKSDRSVKSFASGKNSVDVVMKNEVPKETTLKEDMAKKKKQTLAKKEYDESEGILLIY